MRISVEEVRRLAELANLNLDPESEERLRRDLDEILAYVDKLNELDTSNVRPALGVTEERAGLREDVEAPSLGEQRALANAPEPGRGHFKVPRVIPG
jgi:aspartyl-tRNA(Asn)/glutamyl-tRNA(Gln) amidotransferase subunit C